MGADLLTYSMREPSGEAAGALVLSHGRGASERDLEPLVDLLDPEQRLLAILPRGPLSLPPGGAHWYIVRRVGFPDTETFTDTFARASAWLDSVLAEAGVPPERTVLGGFSQGAVMSYSLGLGAGRPRPAAILAMSGFVPQVDGFELDLAGRRGLPVSITHGSLDPVIGVEFGRASREQLTTGGLDVTYREDPVPHTISQGAVAQARAVLETALPVGR